MRASALFAAAAALSVLTASSQPAAFGTIKGFGQNAEHQRITRRALACPAGGDLCIEPRTLDELAGGRSPFGAVGAADRGSLVIQIRAHCDRADHFDTPGYPQSQVEAQANLMLCRDWMASKMDEAVADAAGLLDSAGRPARGQVGLGCVFVGSRKGRAKCNVLEDMGHVLHTSQDFYSHSNWVDRADPSQAISIDNPPGLEQTGPAPFMSLRGPRAGPPAGLITGCFGIPEGLQCAHRVRHAMVNKDNGVIDPVLGVGLTPRGRIEGNFARAVEAAILDTRDKWALLLHERLEAAYGPERAGVMACVLRSDDPRRDC